MQDVRVKFVEKTVCDCFKLQKHTWERSAACEDFQNLLKGFFEKEPVIFLTLHKGSVVTFKEV